ncbi:MAG: ABC transporter substrate-binding protein, partial [Dehalococcoidia bacterium]|nr:ABC transporter substrate-binding protein [Dehalococcoidia bacterium]
MKQFAGLTRGWTHWVRVGVPVGMVAALLVTACGGGEEVAPTSPPIAATTAPTPIPTVAPTATATPVPVPTGQVRIAMPELLDQSFSPKSAQQMYYADPVFDHTVGVDNDGKLDSSRGLASSWQASADSKTWTFKLRDTVVFSNGQKATPADVDYIIRWVTRADTKVTGGSALRSAIDTIEVPDGATVTFKLKAPDLFFPLNWLAPTGQGFISAVIPKAYFEQAGEAGFNRSPIGSGPYVLKENNIGNNIVLEATARHWYYGVPKVKTVEFRIVPETSTRSALVITGGMEMAATDRTEAPRLRSQGLLVTTKDSAGVVNARILEQYKREYPGYGPNPLADQRVRNALDLAVDRKVLVDTFLKGLAIPSVNYIPMPWDPAFERLPVPAQNLVKAKQMLQDAGFAGFSLDVYIFEQAGLPEGPQMMEALAVWWEQIGVKVNRIST